MATSEVEIANLLYRYAECVDTGDLEGVAALFEHATIKARELTDAKGLLELWRASMIMYDGVPRTKHVITNPIIVVDEEQGTAECRSYYTVFQQAADTPLQPVICGRYLDEFERVDGTWRFRYRDYSLADLWGDLSRHSRFSAPG